MTLGDPEIIEGLKILIQTIKDRQPAAAILLSGILPRREMEMRIVGLNKNIALLAEERKLVFIDPGRVLLTGKGKIGSESERGVLRRYRS